MPRSSKGTKLPPPLVPAGVDLRDTPLPVEAFIQMAIDQFGISRDEASRLVHETIARRHGAQGNA